MLNYYDVQYVYVVADITYAHVRVSNVEWYVCNWRKIEVQL